MHIYKAIVEYKTTTIVSYQNRNTLIDYSADNVKRVNRFVESISKRKEWLEGNGLSIEDVKISNLRVFKCSKRTKVLII
ncbi:hypothetical protein [Wolbachia endosymbiont of Wuchereria bancrofti]|uniref:hypothetical protein n=1 Tax=Wolbachia endosymbiont of Wuchereria bancrofti TaxID=96496 RepID=UPI000B4C86D5|nr:hypothetical protein [Wolbachia endosymbiont of Wuchereria bancrofti]